jgi:type III pantothenate kinase
VSDILLVDLGNTRLKWVSFGAPAWRPQAALVRNHRLPDVLSELWGSLPRPKAVVVASVSDRDASKALRDWSNSAWSIVPYFVAAQPAFLDVCNGYRDPSMLGADRWAALIGARGETKNSACVVDCGTAVTIDALNADGEFRGGVILPGIELMRDALTRGTAAVRESAGDETSCLGRTTADAVAAGSVYGLAGAIERVVHEFGELLDMPMELLITGGDADRVAAHVLRPARRIPDLVLKGLARVAETLPC